LNRRRQTLELIAIVLTAAGKFIFMDYLNWRFPFVFGASLGWLIYILYCWKKQPHLFQHWGFRKDNFKQVVKIVLPFGFIGFVAMVVIGAIQGTINLTWHIIPILITYPIWGTIQQYLLIALLAGNLSELEKPKLHKITVILLTATLFALVHYPLWWLVLATFILAIFYGFVYLKQRNIYVLGIFHGWLGALFYYTVMNTDPFLDTFGKYL
jgi:membrane protease YdiL (CAAX protease family)